MLRASGQGTEDAAFPRPPERRPTLTESRCCHSVMDIARWRPGTSAIAERQARPKLTSAQESPKRAPSPPARRRPRASTAMPSDGPWPLLVVRRARPLSSQQAGPLAVARAVAAPLNLKVRGPRCAPRLPWGLAVCRPPRIVKRVNSHHVSKGQSGRLISRHDVEW